MCLSILWRDADGLANPGYGFPGSACLQVEKAQQVTGCLLYTSDAADDDYTV